MPRPHVKPVPLVAMSPFQASEATGIRQEKISAAIRSGELAAHRIGTKTKITTEALWRWIDSFPPPTRAPRTGEIAA